MSDINEQAKFYNAGAFPDKTDRSYDLLLLRLERWLDELATFGPSHVSVVYRQMAKVMENEIPSSYAEPHIDFNHQKNYN